MLYNEPSETIDAEYKGILKVIEKNVMISIIKKILLKKLLRFL